MSQLQSPPPEGRRLLFLLQRRGTTVIAEGGRAQQRDGEQAREWDTASGKIKPFDLGGATYYTGHETIIPSGRRPGLPRWREALFAFMHHNAQRPGAFFKIPGSQIMEIGVEFEI